VKRSTTWAIGGAAALLLLRARTAGAGEVSGMPDPVGGFSPKVQRFAEAIAYAEGYYAGGNPIPRRLNNPGDLKVSSVPSIGKDPGGHLHFATIEDGWLALHRQLQLIIDGKSRVYTLDMTLDQMAKKYAEWSSNWARNVATRLGVSETARLRDLLT
jgi:hypothetical protein